MNRRWSIATGVALLVLAVVAGATQGLVFSGLDPDRPATFVDSGPALALAAVAFVTVVLLDVVIGWGLWRVLRDRAPRASGLAAALRIGYAGWLAVATIWLGRAAGAGAEGSAQAAAHYAVFDRPGRSPWGCSDSTCWCSGSPCGPGRVSLRGSSHCPAWVM